MNHSVVMTPSQYCYLDLKQGDPELEPELGYSECRLSTAYSYNPIPGELSMDKAKYILGVQGNLCGESIQNEDHAHYMLFPRLQAVAEVGWTPADNRNWDDFVNRLEQDMEWMDEKRIGYARSMYNVSVHIESSDSGLIVKLSTERGNIPIRFTVNGTIPTEESEEYSGPLELTKSVVLKTAAFRDGNMLGKVKTKEIKIHKAMGKSVKLQNQPSAKYPGIKGQSLTDLLRGSLEINHAQWMGFEADNFIRTRGNGYFFPILLKYLFHPTEILSIPLEKMTLIMKITGMNHRMLM